jgi:CRP-like cAMP-binding protein
MKPLAIKQAWNGAEMCKQCPVRELVLFADLEQDDFNLLHLPIDDFDIQTGETLYNENDGAKYVYTIRSGMIKLVRYLSNGNYRIVRLLHQGDLAGIEALNGSTYLHHAIALKNTAVCRIPIEDIEQLNNKTPHLYKQLTARWQKVQSDADIWLAELTVGSSKKRVANLLLYLESKSLDNIVFLPARDDIGALLAITTETSSRITAEFKRLGYVKKIDRGVLIDRPSLENI